MMKIKSHWDWVLVSESGILTFGCYEKVIHKFQVMTEPERFDQSEINRYYEPFNKSLFICKVNQTFDENKDFLLVSKNRILDGGSYDEMNHIYHVMYEFLKDYFESLNWKLFLCEIFEVYRKE